MSYRETYDNLCVLLEEYGDSDVETVAEQIMGMLGLAGEDNLEALDPPAGLRTWLGSHGLSLVATAEARAPRVWDALESTGEQEDVDLEGEDQGVTESVPLQVGDYVEYRTAPSGPHNQSQIGAGYITGVEYDGMFLVKSYGRRFVVVNPHEDFIQLARPAP